MTKNKVNLMLDSGAFSAWFHNDPINIKEYIQYIKDHMSLLDSYVTLDTIPGKDGRMDRNPDSIKKSAASSYKNQQIMKDAGLAPIPVFHQGEEWEWLFKMMDEGETYIGISPYLRSTDREVRRWLDDCFTRLVDSKGRPIVKTHGFGATGTQVMRRYPWYSVDSTTWTVAGGYGKVRIPAKGKDGKPDFNGKSTLLHISNLDTEGVPSIRAQDYDAQNLGTNDDSFQRDWIEEYIKFCGMDMTDVRNDQYCRMAALVSYFKCIESEHKTYTLAEKYRRATFLDIPNFNRKHMKHKLKIVLATQISNNFQASVLTRAGISSRLLSYYILKDVKKKDRLEEYVKRGIIGPDPIVIRPPPKKNWEKRFYKDFRRRKYAKRFKDEKVSTNETDTPA